MTRNVGFYRRRRIQDSSSIGVLLLPGLVLLAIFAIWPMFEAIRVSLLDYDLFSRSAEWVGLEQYRLMAEDSRLWRSFGTTAVFFILFVPLRMLLALGLATLLWRPFLGVALARTAVLVPTVSSLAVVSVLWGLLYHPTMGPLATVARLLGLTDVGPLADASTALPAVALMMIWKEVGFAMVFYLAGLTTVPETIYEAARVDGASGWQQFWRITVPLLRGTHIFVLFTSTIFAFKIFTPVYIMTRGGPADSTRVIVLHIFEEAFRLNRTSYAAAISVLLAVALAAAAVAQFRVQRRSMS